jgi:hypothetical protein
MLGNNVSFAQQTDSLIIHTLENISIYDKRSPQGDKSATGLQVMDSARLEEIPALQLSDVISYFSGVVVKDYGGVGGLKTVSVRSLGANHTLVSYDGLAVSNYQTGQINIGYFPLDNMSEVSLNSGNENDIFQPARLFSQASILRLQTVKPVFADHKPVHVKLSFRAGSFQLFNPALLLENKIGRHITTSLYTEYSYNKGQYPFTISNGDSALKEKRSNSDVQLFRTDANCFVRISAKQELSAKVFYYYAEQGLPGAIILYNTQSHQRMWEENMFIQLHYQYAISEKITYQSNGKTSYSYLRYLDPDYLNAEGKLDNRYWQREYYLSNAVLYKPLPVLVVSLSNDVSFGNMNTSMPDFSNPQRYTSLTAGSIMYSRKRIRFSATLLHTFAADRVKRGEAAKEYNRFTPSVNISCQPFKNESLTIRAFYKNSFRLPTFNDLYYRLVGNINLSPEEAHQFDLGFTWLKYLHAYLPRFSCTADVYYNRIRDKIIAIPNQNLFVWSMLNLGKVNSIGVDMQILLELKAHKQFSFELSFGYSFQYAVDVTNKDSKTFQQQIPYTPQHSGSGIFSFQSKWIHFSYTVLYVGYRYSLGQNILANYLEGYFDHNVAVFRNFKVKNNQLTLRLELLNLLGKQYEVVKSYPMTGRQFQGKLIFKV